MIYILGGCVVCAIIVTVLALRAPFGREIPGVGFVLDDEPADQVADCDPWITSMARRAVDPSFHNRSDAA